jgi:hypothetical protein
MIGWGGVGYLNGHRLLQVAPISSGSICDLESWEREETLQRMHIYGIDNVRGWIFTDSDLEFEQHEAAYFKVCERFDLCCYCGHAGHVANDCTSMTVADWI